MLWRLIHLMYIKNLEQCLAESRYHINVINPVTFTKIQIACYTRFCFCFFFMCGTFTQTGIQRTMIWLALLSSLCLIQWPTHRHISFNTILQKWELLPSVYQLFISNYTSHTHTRFLCTYWRKIIVFPVLGCCRDKCTWNFISNITYIQTRV